VGTAHRVQGVRRRRGVRLAQCSGPGLWGARTRLRRLSSSCEWDFLDIITRQAIRRGSFDSVRDLVDAIRAFIDGWNERCEPFLWTKDADTILTKAKRKTTSDTRH
jgi:hypothetical protein